MAQKIKKKYLEDGAVDGVKLKLLKDQSVKGQDQLGNDVDLIKLDSSDKVLLKGSEAAFKSDVESEKSRAQGEEQRIESLVNTEKSRAMTKEGELESSISTLSSELQNAGYNLSGAVSAEEMRAKGEEGRIEGKVDAEKVRAMAKEDNLQSQIDFIKDNSDPAALDSIKEVVTAFQEADGNLNNAISSLAQSASSAVSSEEMRAKGEEQRIEGLVNTEKSRAMTKEGQLESSISTLSSQLQTAGSNLTSAIQNEAQLRASGDASVLAESKGYTDSKVAQEVIDRDAAVKVESDRAKSEESRIEGKVDSEKSRAMAKEGELETSISNAISSATQAITEEQTRAVTKETQLDGEILGINGHLSSLDSALQNETQSRINGDVGLQQEILSLQGALESEIVAAVGTEENRATAAENSLQSQIDALSHTTTTNGSSFQNAMDIEKAERIAGDGFNQAAIVNEAQTRMTEDGLIKGRLQVLEADPITATQAKAYVDGEIASSKTYVDGKVSDLQGKIDFIKDNSDSLALDSLREIVDAFQTADSNINNTISGLSATATQSINAEVQRATGEEQRIEGLLNGEIFRAKAAEANAMAWATSINEAREIAFNQLDNAIHNEVVRATGAEDAIKVRVSNLETAKHITDFDVESKVIGSGDLVFLNLSKKVIEKSLRVSVGRLNLHYGYDYSVSVEMVGGVEVTRLTWMGDFASGGSEEIVGGETVFVEYAY